MITDDIKEAIASIIDDYKTAKIGEADLSSNLEFEIKTACENLVKRIGEQLEELDEDIDSSIQSEQEAIDVYREDYAARQNELYSIDNSYYLTR